MMKFECTNTNYRRTLPQKIRAVELIKTDEPIQHISEELFQEQYILTHTVRYAFWSNTAQLNTKRAFALEAVHASLFKDMLPIVHDILANTDDGEIRQNASLLLSMMKPKKGATP